MIEDPYLIILDPYHSMTHFHVADLVTWILHHMPQEKTQHDASLFY